MDLKVIGIFAAIALGSKLILDRFTSSEAPVETEETKEAHTETGKEHLVNNWEQFLLSAPIVVSWADKPSDKMLTILIQLDKPLTM